MNTATQMETDDIPQPTPMEIRTFRTGTTILVVLPTVVALATVRVRAASATHGNSFASSDVAFDHDD